MPLNGSIVPQTYYNDGVDSPYPTVASPISGATGQLLTCSRSGRVWMEIPISPYYVPIALQYQATSAGAGTTTANIRRVNNGTAGSEVAGFEHTGAVVLSDILSAPLLSTDGTGRITAATSAPAVTITAKNNTASTITKGTVVRISGAQGQNPTIAPAQANAYATADAIGIAAETILHTGQAIGKVMVAGTLTDVDTSAFADGATLYLSATTAGAMTSTEPVKPNWQMQIGSVQHSHPTQGKILVNTHLESTKTEYITDMTSAGEALATLAPMAESTLLGRGAGGGSGNPQSISLGYGTSMSGVGTTLATSLSYDSRFITGDITLTNANTTYDITTITLAAGVWLVMGSAVFTSSTAATTNYTVEIYNDASASTVGSSSASHAAVANLPVNASCNGVVNLASSTVIRLRGIASQNTRTVKYQSNPGTLANASGLVAVRIG